MSEHWEIDPRTHTYHLVIGTDIEYIDATAIGDTKKTWLAGYMKYTCRCGETFEQNISFRSGTPHRLCKECL